MVDILSAEAVSVQPELNCRRVAGNSDIYLLARIEIPVWEDVNYRICLIICPAASVEIVSILREAGCIYLSEI